MPGAVPSDFEERNRFLNYARDPVTPKNRLRWNWVADIRSERARSSARNATGAVDKLIGGWQFAGIGQWRSNYWSLPSGNVYPTGEHVRDLRVRDPIQDCRSGACFPGYLWWNGYIPANQINSHDAQGRPNGVWACRRTTNPPPLR